MAVSASAPKKTIEIFRPGTFTTRKGDAITFSAADVAAIAAGYDPALHEAPIVAGHPAHDDPAQGWVTRVEFVDGRLVAEIDQVNPAFAAAVGRGAYKKISAAFYPPNSASNPKPGQYYLRHVGCLGAMPPAVSGLKPLQFAAGDVDFVEFGQGPDTPLGAFLSQLRDWLAKFGSGASGAEADPCPTCGCAACSCGTATNAFSQDPKGTVMADSAAADARLRDLDAREAKLAAQEAKLTTREVAFSAQERVQLRQVNAAFLDGLIKDGKFLPAQKDNALTFMESLAVTDQVIEFAEGGGKTAKVSPLDAYKRQLAGAPKVVEFGEVAAGDGASEQSVEFSAPPGAQVDPDRLRLHNKAIAFQRQHPDQTYSQAVKAVTKE